jgi:hypothetical protein
MNSTSESGLRGGDCGGGLKKKKKSGAAGIRIRIN